eukprot:7994321-Alexandrium_andersonii.AAC.1
MQRRALKRVERGGRCSPGGSSARRAPVGQYPEELLLDNNSPPRARGMERERERARRASVSYTHLRAHETSAHL